MNLNRFVDKYGDYSFEEVPFTEVDNVLFSALAYLTFDGLVSKSSSNARRLQDVANDFFKIHSKREKNIYAVRKAVKLFYSIKDTKRYRDLLFYNYVYESGIDEQFSAFTIEINKSLVYVSFEGTDQLVSGWKEDFMFSYMYPTISQKKAISYVNRHFIFRRKKIILGGHSKGGNLALVSGMNANFFVKRNIISIYNNDGPGLIKELYESKKYLSIKDRLINILPNYSMVGILMKNKDNLVVVRSMKKGILSHDFMSWVVDDRTFQKTELSSFSSLLMSKISNWLEQYDMFTREKFVISLFSVFDRAGIKSTGDFFENKKLIFKFIMEAKDIENDVKKMIKEFIAIVFQASKEVKIEEFKMMFQKKEIKN